MNTSQKEMHEKLMTLAMGHDKLPMVQIVLMKIDGVEYEMFGPIITDETQDLGTLEEITFSEVVALPVVIAYLTSMMKGSDPAQRNKMQ